MCNCGKNRQQSTRTPYSQPQPQQAQAPAPVPAAPAPTPQQATGATQTFALQTDAGVVQHHGSLLEARAAVRREGGRLIG